MADERTKAKRWSLPRIDTASNAASEEKTQLEDRILNSVANSLSLSPSRLRESFFQQRTHDQRQSVGPPTNPSRPEKLAVGENLTIQTKVLAGSKTIADVETKVAAYSAHSMSGSVVDTEGDEDESGTQDKMDSGNQDDDTNDIDEVDMRSASVMIAPEKIHRASRMVSTRMRSGRQDFDKHIRTPSMEERPPVSTLAINDPNQVELFLGSETAVSKVVVLKPRAGLFDEKLVACLTLSSITPWDPESPKLDLIPPSQMFFAGTQIATIKQSLNNSRRIEPKLIPEVWIPLDSLPTLPETDQVDRRKLRTWVQNANQEVYEQVMGLNTDQPLQHPTSEMERQIQRLVARVLQVPQEQVGMNFTFTQLGGGEITAMALVTNSRVESVFLEVHEILQPNNTLAHLAILASQRGGLAHKWAAEHVGGTASIGGVHGAVANFFDLSPMQKLYFSTRMGGDRALRGTKDGSYRFNQSLLFRVAQGLTVHDISAATDAVVGHHSMLRARFGMVGNEWMQIVLPQIEGSYSFMHYTVSTNQEVESVVQSTQASINVEEGPVFAVAHLQTTDGHQMIYLTAHHLVTDVVSWRLIMHDLDELLQHGSLLSTRAMPFQKWTELQRLDAQMPSGGLPFDICPGDLDYWGLRDSPNTYADVSEASFSLSEELTSILETTCNQILSTESVDIYVSALLLSFAQTFSDRRVPDVWNQEQGRDLWSNDIDISETVGWFTTLCPLNLDISANSDFVDVVRRLKDTRRAIPQRGAHYFASKFFPSSDANSDVEGTRPRSPNFLQIATQEWPIEILFSYAGNINSFNKDLSQGNSVLEQMDMPGRTLHPRTSDIGPAVGRIAVFEVNTTMDHGIAKIKFLYNRNSLHVDRIATWVQNYEHLLFEAIGRMRFADPELTLSDIPQLWATGVTYDGLARLNRTITADLGVSNVKEVEAVYPVTPLQQSILISQAKQMQFSIGAACGEDNGYSYVPNVSQSGNANACHIHTLYEFSSPNGAPIDLERICAAWSQVVARYRALRTVFVDSVAEQGLYDAVVLKRASPNMLFLDATPSEDPVDTLNNLPPLTACPALKSVPRHRLTVCHSPMKTVMKLDVSAALCDMMSVNTLIADLRRGYVTGRALPVTGGDATVFSYSGYLDIMRGLDRERSIAWWTNTLSSITQPCLFPKLDFYLNGKNSLSPDGPRRYDNAHIEISDVLFHKVAEFGRAHKTTTGTILRLAWGLVLRCVTGVNAVCFGYKAPGRSATLEGMRSAVGCFANTIPVAFDLSPFKPLGIMLRQIEDMYNAALPHQHITMAEVRHALGVTGKGDRAALQLFNTVFTFTEEHADIHNRFSAPANFELRNVLNHETTDYDLTMNVHFSIASGRLVVDIGHSILSETQAHNIAHTFGRAVGAILQCASSSVHLGAIDLFSDRDNAQIINWTNPANREAQQQRTLLHELVFAQSITSPDAQAVCAHDGDLTYAQIEYLSHRLAHILLEAGVLSTPKSKVAVPAILDKSKWAPIALLAVLKVGAALVPVDADEMGFVAKIAGELGPTSKVAIACASAAEALEDMNTPVPLFDRVICLDDALLRRLQNEAPVPGQLLPPSNPDDVACVFFSPTSSRSVRGISFTHTALSTAFIAQGPAAGINTTTRVLQLSSFNVDVALSEIFTTLVNGGVVCIPTSRDRYNDYTGCVSRFNANWSYMTPLLARKLNVELLTSLKTVCFRTRGLDEDTYASWKGKKRVVMAYGAPEVCPLGIAFLEIHGPHHLRAIGRPIAGSAWIVSCEDHRNLMPVGAVGEMVIEGPTLGKTYRATSMTVDQEDAEEPNKNFAETPLSPESRSPFSAANANTHHQKTLSSSTAGTEDQSQGKKRYYKTGHSVRYIEGGLMEYVSSKRDDVEINGRVVNLAELERYIRRALGPGVDVMVETLTFKGERGRPPTLAAFLELGSDVNLAHSHYLDLTNPSSEVKQKVFVAKKLIEKAMKGTVPDFMIPEIFIPVRHLPTTYSLKVNRRKLQKVIKGMSREQLIAISTIDSSEQQAQDDRVNKSLPMNGLEKQVRAVWARILEIAEETINHQDGFIKLGGDEILAKEAVVQCRKEGLQISIADLMRGLPLTSVCRTGGYYGVPPGQAITIMTSASTDDVSDQERTMDSTATQAFQQGVPHEEQLPLSPTAATTPAPQVIDKSFIDETLAPKLNLEPNVIRDVAEATSTQIRSIETAILSQGIARNASSSSSAHGPGLANIQYLVFHFTAPSSTSALSARRIEEVCQILTSIHPILRTAFIPHVESQTRKLYQVVLKNQKVDFKHIPRVQSWRLNAQVDKEIKKDRERVISLVEPFSRPITKFIFLDAGKTSTLVLRLSKAQYDDTSIALLMKDLRKLYDGGQNPPRRPGFADFVREAALAQVGGEAEKYWRGLLEGANPTQVIRHAKPPKLSTSLRTLRETVFVNTTTMGGLGIAMDTVLKGAWGMVLATISGTPDVVFGEIVEGCHSRLQHHLGPSSVNRGGVLGPTSTVLPVRIRFADDPTSPLHLLKCVADQRTAGVPYENLGMLDIVEKCTPWPYWTRLSTVVQHRTDPELLVDGRTTSFRLGSALCKVSIVESEVLDIPDLLVRSFVKSKKNVAANPADGPIPTPDMERDKPMSPEPGTGSFKDTEEELEIAVSFCEQRVPANLAQEVLNKLCGYVGLLTGFSILQNVVPTAAQYSTLAKQIPLSAPMFGTSATNGTGGLNFSNPISGHGGAKANLAQLEAKMIPEQVTTIQSTIEEAWRATLDPRTLGVPEEHVTGAAFYDLWGSLMPAAQLADYLSYAIPQRLVGELGGNLYGGNLDGFRIHMEEIVDSPTMLGQFELVVRKAFGGEGRDRSGGSLKSRSNSIPHSLRKSSSLTNMSDGASAVRKSTATDKLNIGRAGTIAIHGPSKLGHGRTRSDMSERTTRSNASSSNGGSPSMVNTAPVFPVHPAVAPPINGNNGQHPLVPSSQQRGRKGSDASSGTQNTGMTGTATASTAPESSYTAPSTASNTTPPTSYTSPDPSELPGSSAIRAKRSNSIRALELSSPESPVLGSSMNLAKSPPVVQTGFVAARKKTNFGLGSSLKRIASNALRPGLPSNLPRSPPANTTKFTAMQQTPPHSAGSDNRDKFNQKDLLLPPSQQQQPPSPWVRVQSMAPQLPPFPPFTPVTEDAFSMTNGNNNRPYSPDFVVPGGLSRPDSTANASPEQILQRISGQAAEHGGSFFGTLEIGPNGELYRMGGDSDVSELSEEDEEDESTLRPQEMQKYLAAVSASMAVHQPQQSPQHPSPSATASPTEANRNENKKSLEVLGLLQKEPRKRHSDQAPVPSPVTETFYMEEDDESEMEVETGRRAARRHIHDDMYDSLEELDEDEDNDDDDAQTPRQREPRPITVIHSPQGADSATMENVPQLQVSEAAAANGENKQPNGRSCVGGNNTQVQDFASLEAAEMDDMVSPLTPVERAMLYKQQAAQNLHRTPSRLVGHNISPLTPGSYFSARPGQAVTTAGRGVSRPGVV